MRKLVLHWLEKGERPERFRRDVKDKKSGRSEKVEERDVSSSLLYPKLAQAQALECFPEKYSRDWRIYFGEEYVLPDQECVSLRELQSKDGIGPTPYVKRSIDVSARQVGLMTDYPSWGEPYYYCHYNSASVIRDYKDLLRR